MGMERFSATGERSSFAGRCCPSCGRRIRGHSCGERRKDTPQSFSRMALVWLLPGDGASGWDSQSLPTHRPRTALSRAPIVARFAQNLKLSLELGSRPARSPTRNAGQCHYIGQLLLGSTRKSLQFSYALAADSGSKQHIRKGMLTKQKRIIRNHSPGCDKHCAYIAATTAVYRSPAETRETRFRWRQQARENIGINPEGTFEFSRHFFAQGRNSSGRAVSKKIKQQYERFRKILIDNVFAVGVSELNEHIVNALLLGWKLVSAPTAQGAVS